MIRETLNTFDTQIDAAIEKEANLEISAEEQAEVKKLMNLFHIWKRYRARYDKPWMTYYKFFRGAQWDMERPSWKSNEIINLIWQTIQSQVPIQTDVRPKFEFLAQEPSDVPFAEILDSVSDSDWEKFNWLKVVFEILLDGWLYGTSYGEIGYEQSLEYGAGAATFKNNDIFHMYPDPDANDLNDPDSKGLIKAFPMSTEKLKSMYPSKADFIKPNIKDYRKKERTEINIYKSNYYNSDVDLPEYTMNSNQESSDDIPRTLVLRFYLKPNDVEEIETKELSEDGEEKSKFTVQKKYPKGRYVVIANGMILEDGPLPFGDMLIPFAKYNNYILPREFYGVSEVEQLKTPQTVFNKILCFSLDALAMMGNPIWIIDNNSNIDTDELANIPGGVIEKSAGSEVRREMGVTINPSIFQMLDRLVEWYNGVAGQSEFSQGSAPGGVTAASAIEQLIQQSRTRIRQKQRNLDALLKDAGRLYMNRVFEFYSVPKIFRITNDDGSTLFRKFSVEKDEAGQRKAIIIDSQVDEQGIMVQSEPQELIIKGNFDVRIKTGSDLPFDIADKERKAFSLFDRGIIDAEEVLNQIEYPNREKIIQRLQERQAQEAQLAAAQQGA